jgi:hypothetical protein
MLKVSSKDRVTLDNLKAEGAQVVDSVKSPEPISHAKHILNNMIDRILTDVGSDIVNSIIVLSGNDQQPNYREAIAKTPGPNGVGYKAGRPERPDNYRELKRWFIERYNPEVTQGMEGDDLCGINHYNDTDTILCTNDKDLNTIAGYKYNISSATSYYVDEHTALVKYWMQMLTGDIGDNIPGIRGIGKTQAERLLGDETDNDKMQGLVQLIYQHEGCIRKLTKARINVKQRIIDQMVNCSDCQLTNDTIDRYNEIINLLHILRTTDDSAPLFDSSLSDCYNYKCRDDNRGGNR